MGHVTSNYTAPAMWQDGKLVLLEDSGEGSDANAINSKGQVVGIEGKHAALWQDGTVKDLDPDNVESGVAFGINDAGQIIGTIFISEGNSEWRAVLWENGFVTDFTKLLPANFGSFQPELNPLINNRGQIILNVVTGQGQNRAFLLAP